MSLSIMKSLLSEDFLEKISWGLVILMIYAVLHLIEKCIVQSVCRFIIFIWDALVNLFNIQMAKHTAKIQSTQVQNIIKQKSLTKYEWMLVSNIHNQVEPVKHTCIFTEKKLRIKQDFVTHTITPELKKNVQRGFLFNKHFKCFDCIRYNIKNHYHLLSVQEQKPRFFLTLSNEFEFERWGEDWCELAKAIFGIARKFDPCVIFIHEIGIWIPNPSISISRDVAVTSSVVRLYPWRGDGLAVTATARAAILLSLPSRLGLLVNNCRFKRTGRRRRQYTFFVPCTRASDENLDHLYEVRGTPILVHIIYENSMKI